MAIFKSNPFNKGVNDLVTVEVHVRAAAEAVDQWVWRHPGDENTYELVEATCIYGTVGGAAAAAMLEKASGTTAVGSGTDLMTAGFDLTATVNTLQTGALATSADTRKFISGERVGIDFSGTVTGFAGGLFQLVFRVASY